MILYKHIYNTDVAMCVLIKYFIPEHGSYKLKVIWFNIVNPNNVYSTGVRERLEIPREKFHKEWKVYK